MFLKTYLLFTFLVISHATMCRFISYQFNAMQIKFTGSDNSTIISLHYATELELHAFIIPISIAGILSHQRGYSSCHQTV